MTTREKLHSFVDELTDAEAEATLVRLTTQREELRAWAEADEDRDAVEDAWALANAREAINEEPW